MTKADSVHSTPQLITPADPTRRSFLSTAAGVAAGSTVLALAAISPASAIAAQASALGHPDAPLLELEEKIFEQHDLSAAYDDEIMRLAKIWNAESHRRYQEALAAEKRTGIHLSWQERWKLYTDIPECIEHDRLCQLQEPFDLKMDALIKQMFATPAHTAEGRRAKAAVLISCIMGDDWRYADEQTEYPERMARALLLEFVGGEPGASLRDQFA